MDFKIEFKTQKEFFIALAAEDLLEALEAIVNGQGSDISYDDAMHKARAAIAKAKGEA